jgi:hypothetical protein
LCDDPSFALHSYNWITFGTCEFHLRCRAGCLGDVGYFNRELCIGLDSDAAKDHQDVMFVNGGVPDLTAVDLELQPVDLTEKEALELAIAQSELDMLGQWCGLAMHLHGSLMS